MTINLNNQVILDNATGIRNNKKCKPVICIETGEFFTSCLDAADHAGVEGPTMSTHCNGITKSCRGKHYQYLSNTSENVQALAKQVGTLNEQKKTDDERIAELRVKADLYDNNKHKLDELESTEAELARCRAFKAHRDKVAELRKIMNEAEAAYNKAMEEYYAEYAALLDMQNEL